MIEIPNLKIPRVAPVMVLPNTLLFPDSLLPLYIFEERYREMLAWALEHERVICMALIRKGHDDWFSSADFHHVAGLGLIRACVGREDGSSHLILEGLARVEFTGFEQTEPFVIAKLRKIPVSGAAPEEAAALSAVILKLCAQHRERGLLIPEALDQQFAAAPNAAALSDLVAHTIIRDPYRRQSVLEAGDISARLQTLIGHLRAELPSS